MASAASNRFIGVRKKGEGRFGAQITHPVTKTPLWLGTYSSPEVAACAYDLAVRELKGEKAKTNFPHPPPARLVMEVIAAPRHRSHGHGEPLFQVVTVPRDPAAPPPPPPKLVVYFPFLPPQMKIVARAESCLSSSTEREPVAASSSSRRLPKLYIVPITAGAPAEGTGDNYTANPSDGVDPAAPV